MSQKQTLAEQYGIKLNQQLGSDDSILLLEEHQDLRLIVAHHLDKLGFKKIKQFSNGYDALTYLKERPKVVFPVTIASRDMPGFGGYQVLAELKENPQLSRGAFIISLYEPGRSDIMFANESGVDEVIVKPFTLKELLPKLSDAYRKFYNPNNPEQVYELAKAELRASSWDKAEHIYNQLAQSSPNSARPLVGLARIAFGKRDFAQAETWLREALGRNAYYVSAYFELARVFALRGLMNPAVEHFKAAIQLSPLNPLRYEEATELLCRLQRHEEALELLDIALQNQLSFPSLHSYLSQVHYALKDYKKSIRHIKLALGSEPENVIFLNQLGICYKESMLFEEATKTYNSIIKIDPQNRAALYNKSILLHARGQNDEAVKLLRRCLEKFPDFEAARHKLQEFEANHSNKKVAG